MKIDMSRISKKSKSIAAVAFVLGAAALGTGVTYAETSASDTNPMSTLVTAIAQKFNLNSSDVQNIVNQVMTEERTKMGAKHDQRLAERLNKGVTDGKLTQAQANLITAKKQEIKTFMESLKGKSVDDRHAAMKSQMESLKQWATDNKIPGGYLMFGGRGHGGHGGLGFGPKPNK